MLLSLERLDQDSLDLEVMIKRGLLRHWLLEGISVKNLMWASTNNMTWAQDLTISKNKQEISLGALSETTLKFK